MKFRVIAFVLVLVIVFSALPVSAASTYQTESINVYYDGVKIEQEVIVDGDNIFAPISWLTYFGLMSIEEQENEYVVYYPEQKVEKDFARRIFISKDKKPKLEIGYYYDATTLFDKISDYYSSLATTFDKLDKLGKAKNVTETKDDLIKGLVKSLGGNTSDKTNTKNKYTIIYSEEFSKSVTQNNELYLPVEELLPLINARIGVSDDGAICIAPNHYSLFRVLYDNDISSNVFDIDEAISGWQKHTINVISYTVSTLNGNFQRLDFISHSGETKDYKDIFNDFLTDDEDYLSAVGDTEERKAAEYVASTTKDISTALKTVNSFNIKDKNSTGEEIRIFEMFADTIYTSYDDEYYLLKDFNGITEVVGKSAEVMDYLYTYASQVEDHRNMLNAVYNCSNYSSGKDTARLAAYTVEKSFGEDYTTSVVTKITSGVYDDIIEEAIEEIPKAISSSLFTAVKSTSAVLNWIPSTKKSLEMMDENVQLNYYHDIAKDAYSSYMTNIFSDDLTAEKLENARLSLLMAMLASKNAYSTQLLNHHKDKVENIEKILKMLYLAADGTECEGSDHYPEKRDSLKKELSNLSFDNSDSITDYSDSNYSEYIGVWTSETANVTVVFNAFVNKTATFFIMCNTADGSKIANSETMKINVDNNNELNFDYKDSWNNTGHGKIKLNGESIHIKIDQDSTDTGYGIYGNEKLYKTSDKPFENTYSSNDAKDTVSTRYKNNQYGWSVGLPEGWLKYGGYEETDGGTSFVHKELNKKHNLGHLFTIYAVPVGSSTDDKQSGDMPRGGYLGENFEYAFYWWGATDVQADEKDVDFERQLEELYELQEYSESILNSFKLE